LEPQRELIIIDYHENFNILTYDDDGNKQNIYIIQLSMSGQTTCRVTPDARNQQIIDCQNLMFDTNRRIAQTELQFDHLFDNMKYNIITREQYENQVSPIRSSLMALCGTLQTALEFFIELHREMN